MSHHSDRPFDALSEEQRETMRKVFERKIAPREGVMRKQLQEEIGATGEFPEGKISEHDEGEIAFAIGHRFGKVLIEFGKPVAWVGMTPQQAIALANALISHARKAREIGSPKTKTRHKAEAK